MELNRQNRLIKDREVHKEYESFRDSSKFSSCLFTKDDKYFLLLSDKTESLCIALDSNKKITKQIETIAVNMEYHHNQFPSADKTSSVSIDGKDAKLVEINDLKFSDDKIPLQSLSELKDKNIDVSEMTAYSASIIYKDQYQYNPSDEEAQIIKYYKSSGYEYINSFMREGELKTRGVNEEKINPEFCRKLLLLNDIFDKAPKTTKDMVVYRGSNHQEKEATSFISTSLSKKLSSELFGKNLYEINVPKGSCILNIDAIPKIREDYMETEAEVLLRPSYLDYEKPTSDGQPTKVTLKEANFPVLLLNALKKRKDSYLKGKSNEAIDDYQQAITYVSKYIDNTKINKIKKLLESQKVSGHINARKMKQKLTFKSQTR